MPAVDASRLARLDPQTRREALRLLGELDEVYAQNPLEKFHACERSCGPGCKAHPKQREFLAARTRIQAAFAGNRFGKSTALVVKALCQVLPEDYLPERIKPFRLHERSSACGRIVCPDLNATLYGVLLPAFRQWTPRDALLGGSFDKAWDKQRRLLRFKDPDSWVQFMTYEMDLDKFGGSALDFVGYDEPPPQDIREECRVRLLDRAGFEMFAMTPLMGIGWVYREIWKKREHPDITVVQGSIHDNSHNNKEAVEAFLADRPPDDPERRAREFGEFAHFGGMVYPTFGEAVVDPPEAKHVKGLDTVVGIDPGMRNAAFVYVGFDADNVALVYDELLLQDQTPADYARALHAVNEKWGVKPTYVIDPSARNRSLVNAESVEAELTRYGIYCVHGQNMIEAGVQQVRARIQAKRLLISRACFGLRDEADEYRVEQRPDGEFRPVKENDHRLDALRYALMYRPWLRGLERRNPKRMLGMEEAWPPPTRGGSVPPIPMM